jgi:glycosyltransferase involved in cell wall biosynthesis
MMMLSIVIPTYNSATFIGDTLAACAAYAAEAAHAVEVIVVDDGSDDATFATIKEIAPRSPVRIIAVQLFRNRGQFHALMAGLQQATGDYIVTLDDDLEYHPNQIPRLLQALQEQPDAHDVIIGVPEVRRSSWLRRWGSSVANALNSTLVGKPRHLRTGTFRLMTGEVVRHLREFRTANPIMAQLIFRVTRRVTNVTVEHRAGLRPSNYSLRHLMQTMLRMTQLYSDLPMQYMMLGGLFLSALSILSGLLLVIRYITGFPRPIAMAGWTSTMVSIYFFSGLILFAVGMLGQYAFRIYEEVNKQPNFQVRDLFDSREEPVDDAHDAVPAGH